MRSKIFALTISLAVILLCFSLSVSVATAPNNDKVTFLESNGKLYDADCNNHGQLGIKDTKILTPTQIGKGLGKVENIVCNSGTTLFTIDGKLYGTGCNDHGQLGTGNTKF